jgi:hypothetical protein
LRAGPAAQARPDFHKLDAMDERLQGPRRRLRGHGSAGLRRAVLGCALLATGCAAGARPAGAQELPPAVPAAEAGVQDRGERLRIYLLTMGPGDAVWERFGHNALWVHDPDRVPDPAYNYGIFDFEAPNFLGNFIRGRMLYMVAASPVEWTVESYIRADRGVWAQELNLTPAQRMELADFLEWNVRPENRDYRYDYYRDNCSTRLRDALDLVLGGALRAATAERGAGTTYREHTRRLAAADPPLYFGLQLAMGHPIDREISVWEEMFLPMELRRHLAGLTLPGPDGTPVPVVVRELVVHESTRTPEPATPPLRWPFFLLGGVLLGGGAAALGRRAGPAAVRNVRYGAGGAAPRTAGGAGWRRGFLATMTAWALLNGILGAAILYLWLFTDHWVTYRNENVLQFHPVTLLLAAALWGAAAGHLRERGDSGGAGDPRRPRFGVRLGPWLALAVAGVSVGGLALALAGALLPGGGQGNGEILALAVPAHLGVAAGTVAWLRPEWWPRRGPAPFVGNGPACD